jgi:hypothetical protein
MIKENQDIDFLLQKLKSSGKKAYPKERLKKDLKVFGDNLIEKN